MTLNSKLEDDQEKTSCMQELNCSSIWSWLSVCGPATEPLEKNALAGVDDVESESPVILITGFGPFNQYKVNPSWQAVSGLPKTHNGVRIIRKEIPVAYADVKSIVPSFLSSHILGNHHPHHHKNKVIAVIHVGVGRAGQFKLECLAHRDGYDKPDIHGKFPPKNRAAFIDGDQVNGESQEVPLLSNDNSSVIQIEKSHKAPHVMHTTTNVTDMKTELLEKSWKVDLSDDAGRFLCEFIYYTSMYNISIISKHSPKPTTSNYGSMTLTATQLSQSANSQDIMNGQKHEDHDTIPALFVHVPPTGDPYTVSEMTSFLLDVIDFYTRQ